jgi:hypothetical protein
MEVIDIEFGLQCGLSAAEDENFGFLRSAEDFIQGISESMMKRTPSKLKPQYADFIEDLCCHCERSEAISPVSTK